ncbi:MAG: HPr family phosphocarrier protein [Deltaproteobacteria bacterium]
MRRDNGGVPGAGPGPRAVERPCEIRNRLGLHARAAAKLVHLSNRYAAEIRLVKDEVEVNGKSIMGVLMLAAPRDSRIVVRAEGPDADAAVEAIAALIDGKFGEE